MATRTGGNKSKKASLRSPPTSPASPPKSKPTAASKAGEVGGGDIKVSLATPDDIPELIAIFWEAFSGPGETIFPHTDDGRAWLERGLRNFLGGPSYYRPESKVPVVRNAHGKHAFLSLTLSLASIGFSLLWKIHSLDITQVRRCEFIRLASRRVTLVAFAISPFFAQDKISACSPICPPACPPVCVSVPIFARGERRSSDTIPLTRHEHRLSLT